MLEERTIIRSVLDQTENHSRPLGPDCRVSLAPQISIELKATRAASTITEFGHGKV
jgi:hypothetical protein